MLALLALLVPPAEACVGLVHTPEELAATAGQQLLFERDADASVVTYRVRYEGDATSFGWVIPVPGRILDVTDGDDAVFDALDEATRPTVTRVTVTDPDDPAQCGCLLGSPKSGDAGDTITRFEELDVTVEAEGFTGTWAWAALDADSSADLDAWLAERGFTAGLPAGTTDPYVLDGSWRFLAVTLQRDALPDGALGDLPPIRIRYDSTVLSWPARMARLMTGSRYRFTVWVRGAERATVNGWPSEELGPLEGQTDAVAVFDDAVYQRSGAAPGLGVVWAGRYEDGWLTRFDGFMEAEAHTSDPVFRLDGGTLSAATDITLWGASEDAPATLWLPVLALGWAGRRRREGTRRPDRGSGARSV